MQKDEDDKNHKGHRLKQRFDDFLHPLCHSQRSIERDDVIEIRRKLLLRLFHERACLLHGRHCVGTRELVNGQDGRALAIEAPAKIIDLRTEIHPGHVLHPHERAIGIGANDDVLEVLFGDKAARRVDREGKDLSLRHGFAADLPGRVDGVLGLDGPDDFRAP